MNNFPGHIHALSFLIDIIHNSDMPQEHQKIFNRVRINLRLLTLSDIVVADSPTRILTDIYKGFNHRISTFNWSVKQEIPHEWMNIFQQTLRNVIMPHLQNNSLGKWTSEGHQKWQHFENSHTSYVTLDNPSHSDLPVDIVLHRRRPIIGHKPNTSPLPDPPVAPSSPLLALQSSPSWMQRLWSGIDWSTAPLLDILARINSDMLYIAGDDYVNDRHGSFSWALASKKRFGKILF